jgi:agmatinase
VTRYVSSSHLEVEGREGGSVVMAHALLGTRLRLDTGTHRLLEAFVRPHALEELVPEAALDKVRPVFDLLCSRSFLVEEGRAETIADRVLARPPRTLFGCPSPAEAPHPADFTFLGVPFDHGNHGEPGARFGPDAIRAAARELHLDYTADPATGRGRGWYDNDADAAVLDGAVLADLGDVFVAPGEAPSHVFDKIRSSIERIRSAGSRPVVLGGDHSITYPVLAAFDAPLAVFHLDAHSDLAPYHPGVENHHGNVMSRVLMLEHVRAVCQVGLRGTTPVSQLKARERRPLVLSPSGLRALGPEALVERLPPDLPFYVSVDVDVLDPSHAPGTSTPVPGGLSFDEVRAVLRALAARRRVIGFDVVEVNPRRDVAGVTAQAALELMLATLAAGFARERRSGDA